MPSTISLAALVGAFFGAVTFAAPTARATCSSTFPATFEVKEGSGYFEIGGRTIVHDLSVPTDSKFSIHSLTHDGDPDIPQLAVTQYGVTYGLWVQDSVNGIIELLPIQSTGASTDIPVVASLNSDCTISLSLWEAHTDSILQDCGGNIVLATSHEFDCVLVTASLVSS